MEELADGMVIEGPVRLQGGVEIDSYYYSPDCHVFYGSRFQ